MYGVKTLRTQDTLDPKHFGPTAAVWPCLKQAGTGTVQPTETPGQPLVKDAGTAVTLY